MLPSIVFLNSLNSVCPICCAPALVRQIVVTSVLVPSASCRQWGNVPDCYLAIPFAPLLTWVCGICIALALKALASRCLWRLR